MNILTKFWDLCRGGNKKFINELLKDQSMREMLIGVDRKPPRNDAKTEQNAARVLNYSKSEDYQIFAKELWDTAISYVNVLTDDNLKTEDVNFYRGCLAATLDDLRISYRAFEFLESQRKNQNPLNGLRGDVSSARKN